jgi:hypothetical protein
VNTDLKGRRGVLAFLACAVALAMIADALVDDQTGARATSSRPAGAADTAGVAGRLARATRVAREFADGYLRYLAGARQIPGGATRGLAWRLQADRPVLSPAEENRTPRLFALTMLDSQSMRASVLAGDGEGVRYRLLLRLVASHGRLLVSQVQAVTW